MEKKEALLIIAIVAGAFFLLNENSLTGFQVFRLFYPGGYSQPSSIAGGGSRFDEGCAFYGDDSVQVANSCSNCVSTALNNLWAASGSGGYIRDLWVEPCVVTEEGGLYFSNGRVSAIVS